MENEYNLSGDNLQQMAYNKNKPYFSFTKKSRKVIVSLPSNLSIDLPTNLRRMLGFEANVPLTNTSNHTIILQGTHTTDLSNDVNFLCIYSNIVEPQFMGDVLVPLL